MENLVIQSGSDKLGEYNHFTTKFDTILAIISPILIISIRLLPLITDRYTSEMRNIYFEDVVNVDNGQMFLYFASNLAIILALISFLPLYWSFSIARENNMKQIKSVATINFFAALWLIPLLQYLTYEYPNQSRIGTFINSDKVIGFYVLQIAIIFGIANSLRLFLKNIF